MKFPGFDEPIDLQVWRETVQVPDRFFSVDGQRFVKVDLESMVLPSDQHGEMTLRLLNSLSALSDKTRLAVASVFVGALDGRRNTSTVARWLSEISLFSRSISEQLDGRRINTVTLGMYLWYQGTKGPSQVKLLRGALLCWVSTGAPGVQAELATHLQTTSPRPARGMIEVQNDEPSERPLSKAQVRSVLDAVTQLYSNHTFDPQSNLLWRLMISEALRPSQMRLMQFGDLVVDTYADGRLKAVRMMAAMVKQGGVPARSYMTEHRLSHAVGQAYLDHLTFVKDLIGEEPRATGAVFGVRSANRSHLPPAYHEGGISVVGLIARTRSKVAEVAGDLESIDLFNRRFKHTKLTHLACAGASLDVLAHAGYQTSTVSLQRYVNLTEEAYAGIEMALADEHEEIANAFRGKVVKREQASNRDEEHLIAAPSLDDEVGSCSATPCGVLACFGCYACDRYEAFEDGPHEAVEARLVAEQERARAAGLPEETIYRNASILAGVRNVIRIVREGGHGSRA
jgi:integrase